MTQLPLPTFFRSAPSTWLQLMEAHFTAHDIEAKNWYCYTLSALPEDIAVKALGGVPTDDYNELKRRIINCDAKSQHERIREAMKEHNLDGKKPSTYVAELQRKFRNADIDPSDAIMKSRLMNAMDPTLQPTLAAHLNSTMVEFIRVADAIYSAAPQTPCNIDAIRKHSPHPESIEQPFHDQDSKVCGYHIRFGRDAIKCTDWCHWPKPHPANPFSGRSPIRSDNGFSPRSPNRYNDRTIRTTQSPDRYANRSTNGIAMGSYAQSRQQQPSYSKPDHLNSDPRRW